MKNPLRVRHLGVIVPSDESSKEKLTESRGVRKEKSKFCLLQTEYFVKTKGKFATI